MAQFQVTGFAVVTGGSGGIGKEVGFTFAEAGAQGVIFADLELDRVQKAAKESEKLATNPSYKALAIQLDVTDSQSVRALFDFAVQSFGRIDYCIHAAGITHDHLAMMDLPEELFDRVMDVNSKGTFLVVTAAARAMRDQSTLEVSLGRHGKRDLGRGSIVVVASMQSRSAIRGHAAYVASKHALSGVVRSCAVECRPYCIRVSQIDPVWVRTPMFEWECERMPGTPQIIQQIVPNKRPIEPDEVASAALYLCSPAGSYLSGIGLAMDYSLSAGPIL